MELNTHNHPLDRCNRICNSTHGLLATDDRRLTIPLKVAFIHKCTLRIHKGTPKNPQRYSTKVPTTIFAAAAAHFVAAWRQRNLACGQAPTLRSSQGWVFVSIVPDYVTAGSQSWGLPANCRLKTCQGNGWKCYLQCPLLLHRCLWHAWTAARRRYEGTNGREWPKMSVLALLLAPKSYNYDFKPAFNPPF